MLFNSYVFIFLFLPITLFVYFGLNQRKWMLGSMIWLIFVSLGYYGWWNPIYVLLIVGSMLFNFTVGKGLKKSKETGKILKKRFMLLAGISGNLFLLGYFKYADFLISNVNYLTRSQIPLLHITLPVGISFFTFTQIAYLVDAQRGETEEYNLSVYALFVSFFPYLLAGPIIHHRDMIPQFSQLRNKILNYKNLTGGLFLFFIGLFKKVVIADAFAIWVSNGFDNAATLSLIEAWAASLSYTLQLYFDFSGYTDMALGSAMMFNIRLPINFDSPYKSLNIQEFWRRWHITLGRFVRNYIYIPLGGNRVSEARTLLNLMVTFFLVGLWHGAGWTFVFWGCLHGGALVIQRLWSRCNIRMPRFLAWFITFNFVNAAWVFFRAKNMRDGVKVLRGMMGMTGIVLPESLGERLKGLQDYGVRFGACLENLGGNEKTIIMILIFLLVSLTLRNSNERVARFKPDFVHLTFICMVAVLSILHLGSYSEFLYFRF
jgi:D-alanyl-lipoteichoic acid acyltransferase DltB (MBOAT superfamily)